MLKAFLASTVISKLLFTIFYTREQRKDSLPSAVPLGAVQSRYVRTWCLPCNQPLYKSLMPSQLLRKQRKVQGQWELQHWQPGNGEQEASASAAGLWPLPRCFHTTGYVSCSFFLFPQAQVMLLLSSRGTRHPYSPVHALRGLPAPSTHLQPFRTPTGRLLPSWRHCRRSSILH